MSGWDFMCQGGTRCVRVEPAVPGLSQLCQGWVTFVRVGPLWQDIINTCRDAHVNTEGRFCEGSCLPVLAASFVYEKQFPRPR